ncbi:riboflavin biosynthesis protein RibF [Leuconostocaceae bacterium ESL0723]|nr:riboflavin biosynthesis protein RibF [Leuconostocaceae bacterium ESL0723]
MTELIKLHYPIQKLNLPARDQVLAMGFFDGLHLGHQAVIAKARAIAQEQNRPLAVLTYSPYPQAVFKKMNGPLRYLTPLDQKVALLSQMGVDRVYCLQLTSQLVALPPQRFVDQVLMALKPAVVVAGFDHLYGPKDLQADMEHLPDYSQGRFDVVTVPEQIHGGHKIGSRYLREALDQGRVDDVNRLLGRSHQTTGIVVHGDARGRLLGFPTVNILTPEQEWLPGIGVYAVEIEISHHWYHGMASIGRNVTFEANRPITVEINILDFDQMVYGEPVRVNWCHWLRGEEKFPDVDSLVKQLREDQAATQAYFKDN